MTASTFALLDDGRTIEIRPAGPQDEDARVRIAPAQPQDPFLRRLR